QVGTTPTPALSAPQLTATAQANLTATANANLTATAQANLTATASVIAANRNPYASGGTLVMLDPLTDNTRGFGWAQGTASDSSGACTFTTAGYQVNSNKTQYYYYCPAANTYSNFTFEAQAKIIKGDCGGLIFRADTNAGKFYLYEVCANGSYNLYQYKDLNGDSNLLANASSPAIKSGLNQTNTLAVTAQGSTLTLYMNGQKMTSVTNSAFTQGQVAFVADSFNNTTGIVFSNARLWTF
ncbi:MAG TPA: family 16 glycoside hydrolase, partial [Ktedonobacteraceae bacterium]